MDTATTLRTYSIEDHGDGFHVSFYQGDDQIGGALFPDAGDGLSFDHAEQVAKSWGVAAFPQPL